ncbi:MAG: heat-inducible transcriptional repressor HrcA [Endomicrobium sp.]|nr:heat-inducible transcriptional repressor HrcA [Endomicrobium sp.]
MRHVAFEVLKERKSKILSSVIHHFIRTGKPVGSKILIEEYKISFSPAAVRSLMASLEKDGCLTHPHTSAGRIPTDKGYRLYVNSLVKLQNFAVEEEERIKKEYERKHDEIESLLSDTSHILSVISQHTGFVMALKTQYDEIKNIELLQISGKELLVVLLTKSGVIKHKRVKAFLGKWQLSRLRKFLNEKLRGVLVAQASERLISDIRVFKENELEILEIAEKVSDVFYDIQDDIYIDGALSNAIVVPNFDDFEIIKALMRFNEDKEKFVEIMNKDFSNGEVDVKIGSENMLSGFKDLSMIATVYKNSERAVGILGIVGPKRMEYQKMMLLVSRISEMLNKFFKCMT